MISYGAHCMCKTYGIEYIGFRDRGVLSNKLPPPLCTVVHLCFVYSTMNLVPMVWGPTKIQTFFKQCLKVQTPMSWYFVNVPYVLCPDIWKFVSMFFCPVHSSCKYVSSHFNLADRGCHGFIILGMPSTHYAKKWIWLMRAFWDKPLFIYGSVTVSYTHLTLPTTPYV